MNSQQLEKIINDLTKMDFVHARLKIDDTEIELDRKDISMPFHRNDEADGTITVNSPMIGIFHANEQPVKIGANVKAGAVLGQIESMKLFNELNTPDEGNVLSVLCQDGEAVEYDQPLFIIRGGHKQDV